MQSWCNCVWGLREARDKTIAKHYTRRTVRNIQIYISIGISRISKTRYFGKQRECVAPFVEPYCAPDTDFHHTYYPLQKRGINCPNKPDMDRTKWICCAMCEYREKCPACCSDAYETERERQLDKVYRRCIGEV